MCSRRCVLFWRSTIGLISGTAPALFKNFYINICITSNLRLSIWDLIQGVSPRCDNFWQWLGSRKRFFIFSFFWLKIDALSLFYSGCSYHFILWSVITAYSNVYLRHGCKETFPPRKNFDLPVIYGSREEFSTFKWHCENRQAQFPLKFIKASQRVTSMRVSYLTSLGKARSLGVSDFQKEAATVPF